MKHFISLGAGVQSSTMALMAAHEEITPMPNGAIFADTQAEPASVYKWLDWLETCLPFPVYRVTHGNLYQIEPGRVSHKTGKLYQRIAVPMHVAGGIMPRQCTEHFKIRPIRRQIIKLLDKGESAKQWIGISFDELDRMKPSRHARIENCWPLVDRGIRRHDCLEWIHAHNYPEPPRSACVFCPYRSDRDWQQLKAREPAEFQKAIAYENAQRARYDAYLHPSLKPLETVMFVDTRQLNLFRNECEGMCGV
jgi:hypothetical protein